MLLKAYPSYITLGPGNDKLACFIVDCGTPTAPANGEVTLTNGNTKFGAIATQSCVLGYDISGSTRIECLDSEAWSAQPVVCTIKGMYSVKPVLSHHSKRRPTLVLKTDYRLMQVKSIAECSHGAFCNTSTFIKLPFVIKTFVLSIFEWPLKTGFTV